jgi:hypothetical protein
MLPTGEEYLARVGISKEECHAIAKSLTGSTDVFPVRFQGFNSYTIQGGAVVVQIRMEPLELETLERAMKIHKTYVLQTTCKQTEPFYVYVTPYGGRPCCAKEFRVNRAAQKTALRDLAVFLAQSCQYPVTEMGFSLDTIKEHLELCLRLLGIQDKVRDLLDNLRNRFQE